ncbi:hypothetical protein AGMMS50276_08570 [Synergistales bacterium]|nr:hypothetical protein AGMMS50276_08570 [Synergistales bacterium]
MGFLNAIRDLGEMELNRHSGDDEFADIDSFLHMPIELIGEPSADEDGKQKKVSRLPGKEIRIYLDVTDPRADTLDVRGVKKIESADFWGGQETDDRAKKRRYLYREPSGSNVTWSFSPIYKLGKGVGDGRKALLGDNGDWRSDKNSRYFKLYKSVLRAFEDKGTFSPGSTDRIMEALVERVDELSEKWMEKKSSHILIFSPCDGVCFLYPLEVPSYLAYFRALLQTSTQSGGAVKGERILPLRDCALCHSDATNAVNLDEIFAFATFDKKSFLPGLSESAKSKVFPICERCYKLLSEGRNVIDRDFTDSKTILGVNIYITPELLLNDANLKKVSGKTKDFVQLGLKNEQFLSERVLNQDDELVFHFVFWEKNQAQERLLLMIEDVPPSRLKYLEKLWDDTVKTANSEDIVSHSNRSTLQQAINEIRMAVMSLAGKNDGDTAILRDLLLDTIGRLMKDEPIDVYTVKSFAVSRLQGLFSDGEWLARYGVSNMRRLQRIVDFLYRVNEKN